MEIGFSFGKCKTRAGYSARLLKQSTLNLAAIAKTFPVILETPILLVIREGDMEIVIHRYGELLFRKGDDPALMEKTAERIYRVGIKQ